MGDSNFVHIRNSLHNLLKNVLGTLFIQFSPLAHIIEQIAPWTQLHDNQVVLFGLKCLKQLDVARMLQTLQNVNFLHHFAPSVLLFYTVSICRLYCDQFASKTMQTQVYLPKGTLSKNFSYLVEFNARFGHLVILLETVEDYLGQESYFSRAWTHLIRCLLAFVIGQFLNHLV